MFLLPYWTNRARFIGHWFIAWSIPCTSQCKRIETISVWIVTSKSFLHSHLISNTIYQYWQLTDSKFVVVIKRKKCFCHPDNIDGSQQCWRFYFLERLSVLTFWKSCNSVHIDNSKFFSLCPDLNCQHWWCTTDMSGSNCCQPWQRQNQSATLNTIHVKRSDRKLKEILQMISFKKV